MAVYLNTYECHQAYGGQEEGGWWYECGTPLQSIFWSHQDLEEFLDQHSFEELKEIRDKATFNYTEGRSPTPIKNGTGGYTFMPGSSEPVAHYQDDDIKSCFEDGFAVPYPSERPYYC